MWRGQGELDETGSVHGGQVHSVLPALGEQAGDEAVRQQERAGQGEASPDVHDFLGHSPLQRLQVIEKFRLLAHFLDFGEITFEAHTYIHV